MTENNTQILVEMFGHYKNEEKRVTDDGEVIPLWRIAKTMFHKAGFPLSAIDTIYTGMDKDVREALETLIKKEEADVELEPFFPLVSDWIQDHDKYTEDDYDEAWKEAFSWRNRALMLESKEDYPTVDFTIFGTDGSHAGTGLQHDASKYDTVSMAIPMKGYVDWDAVFDDDDNGEGGASAAKASSTASGRGEAAAPAAD